MSSGHGGHQFEEDNVTDFIIRAEDVVYWGNEARLLQQIAQLLGVSPDQVTIEIVPAEACSHPEGKVCVWDTVPDANYFTAGSPE